MKHIYYRSILTTLLGLWSAFSYAQAPAGYYSTATGTGYPLKTQLKNIIDGHTVVSYSGLWTAYATTDIDGVYENDGSILDMYSEDPSGADPYNYTQGTDQCGNYSGENSCYNREHSLPKSWFGDASPMYSDIFHVVPTDGYVNGIRGNLPFGETDAPNFTSLNGSKRGPAKAGLGYTGDVFEPIDEFKGDFARIYFYMATRYEDEIAANPWSSPMLDGSSDKVFTDWALDMLISWHENDPVSQKEIDRNNAIYNSVQFNRNPFVDNPSYIAQIWGSSCTAEPTTPPSALTTTVTDASMNISFTGGNGGARVILVSTSAITFEPTDNADYTAVANSDFSAATAQGDGSKIVYSGANTSVTVTGLSPSTTYQVEVFEYCATAGPDYLTSSSLTGSATTNATPPDNPTLSAAVAGTSQIDLSFGLNGNSDNIVIVSNTTGTFTAPTDGSAPPATGSAFAGGNILYQGNAAGSPFAHTSLTSGQTYYYRAFSVDGSNIYSAGVNANATTTATLPLTQDFSNCGDLDGWTFESTQGSVTWTCNSTDGVADINTFGNGNNEDYLISPPMDFSLLTNAANISFDTRERYTGTDLELLYSTDYAGDASTATWQTVSHTFSNTSTTATFSNFVSSGAITLPSIGSNSVRIAFRYTADGTAGGTENWQVDNIVIEESTTAGATANPASFTAGTSIQSNTIGLGFTPNASTDQVVIVFNATGTFTAPSGTPTVGANIAGGEVIYIGTGNSHSHAGLTPATTYYYKAFSYNATNGYSTGIEDNATTSYALDYTPYATSFGSDPTANGWTAFSVSGAEAWALTGTSMQMNAFNGGCQTNEDWLISPPLDFSATTAEELNFDLTHNFNASDLTVLYSTDYTGNGNPNTANWTTIATYTTGNQSITGNTSLSSLNDASVYIAFRYIENDASCAEWTLNSFSVAAGATACTHSITSLSLASGPIATDITLTGSGFTANGGITFLSMGGQTIADYTVVSDTEVKLEVPAGATSGTIEMIVNGCTVSNNDFTLLEGACTPATPSELFFSEYIESSGGNDKALEVYNGTGLAVDLSTYTIEIYSNGNTAAGRTINLAGTLANGDVYVVYDNAAANATLLAAGDQAGGSGLFNGDDAIVLKNGGTVVDAIGQIGTDPGSAWSNNGVSTANQTLTRNGSIINGDTNTGDAFDPSVEWSSLGANVFTSLGSHTLSGAVPTITAQPVDAAVCPGGASFTATATGAGAYQWKVYQDATVATASDLFISEYVEGSSNNKYIEIANITGAAVDLSLYRLARYDDNSTSVLFASDDLATFTGVATIPNNSVIVLAETSAAIYGGTVYNANTTGAASNSVLQFNGDDPIMLQKSISGTFTDLDLVGTLDTNSENFAQNVTLTRNTATVSPSTTYNAGDWTSNATDDISNLGSFTSTAVGTAGWVNVADAGVYAGATTATLTISNVAGLNGTQYHLVVDDGSSSCNTLSQAVTLTEKTALTGAYTWNGSISADWNTAENWESCTVPTSSTDVVVVNTSNDPIINAGDNAVCKSLSLEANSTLFIDTDQTLEVYGDVAIAVGATLDGNDTDSNITFKDDGDIATSATLTVLGQLAPNVELRVDNLAEVKLGSNLALPNASNEVRVLSGGIFDFNGFNVTGIGDFRLTGINAELRITSPEGISNLASTGNLQLDFAGSSTADLTPTGGAIFRYTGSVPQVTGNLLPTADDLQLIIANKGSATVTLSQTLELQNNTSRGSLQILQGTFVETAAAFVFGNGNLTVGGDPSEEAIYQTAANSTAGDATTYLPRLASGTGTIDLNSAGRLVLNSTTGVQLLHGTGVAFSSIDISTTNGAGIGNGSVQIAAGEAMNVLNGGVLNLNEADVVEGAGNFLLNAGATLNYGSAQGITLGSVSDATAGNIRVTNGSTGRQASSFSTEANYGFIGGETMTDGDALPTTVNNLILHKTAGSITLSKDVGVNGSVTIETGAVGHLNTNAQTITLNNASGSLSGEDSDSHLLGRIRQTKAVGATPTNFVGLGVNLTAIPSDIGNVTVTRISGTSGVITVGTNSSIALSWDINSDSNPSSNLDFSLSWGDYFDNGRDYLSMSAWRSSDGGTTWEDFSPSTNSSSIPMTGSRAVSLNTPGFSMWTFSDNNNPLPVQVTHFEGYWEGSRAVLEWQTASEWNSKGFEVQRSTNGVEFTAIGWVNSYGNGNSNEVQAYQFEDNEAGDLAYYRLRQEDHDGSESYSKVIALRKGLAEVSISPNPFKQEARLIANGSTQEIQLTVSDISGKVIMEKTGTATQINDALRTAYQWRSGLYIFQIYTNGEMIIQKVVKQ